MSNPVHIHKCWHVPQNDSYKVSGKLLFLIMLIGRLEKQQWLAVYFNISSCHLTWKRINLTLNTKIVLTYVSPAIPAAPP